jgi:hypothetical protein
MKRVLWMVGALAMFSVGCGDDSSAGGNDAGSGGDGTVDPDSTVDLDATVDPDSTVDPDGGPDPLCVAGDGWCLSHDSRRFCVNDQWQDETCASGSGCVQGACVAAACSDECTLEEVDGARTCELYDMSSGTWVAPDPAASLHDRARAYTQWLRRDGSMYGGVGNASYSDPPTYSNVLGLGGLGDSAIWTGTYLAAEALRLRATGAADARDNVIDLVETLHLWFNVSGHPGLLARFVAPTGGGHPVALYDLNCANPRTHCNVPYDGQSYDYIGHISRDQYQGVMLGYALAYEALGDQGEATRALIRDDVVELMDELMTERSVPIAITYNGTPIPAFNVTMRFTVLDPEMMSGGELQLTIDSNNPDDSEMTGFQEFIPNLQDVLSQMPVIGGMVPSIPRAGSGVMLASFFRVGMLVTEGVAGYQSAHAALADYYTYHSGVGGNVNDWLAIASQWSYNGDCGSKYYANNIVAEPLYNLARLETDPALVSIIRNDVLHNRLWAEHQGTKNSFFYFMYAANYPTADGSIGPEGAAQLAGFPPPPRVKVAVDQRTSSQYLPHESGCTDQVDHSSAVDVAHRVVSDFLWQRHPWALHDIGSPNQTFPGVDYLAAYWFGRHHGFISDDTPSQCLVWR